MAERVDCLYRVSTTKQVDHDELNQADIPVQRKACRDFAEKMGWVIVNEEQETGVSGYKVSANDRDKLQLIKKRAEQGIVSVDNGLDEACRLREWDRRMAMLLVADTQEYVCKGYDLDASAYLLRPVEPEMLERGLASALCRLNQSRAFIDLPAEGGTCRELINSILYIEDEGSNSKVHTFDREYRLLVPLSVLGLPKHFFSCDGRRVNLAHVDQIANKNLVMGDFRLPISRKARKNLINSLPMVVDISAKGGLTAAAPRLDNRMEVKEDSKTTYQKRVRKEGKSC